MQLLSTLARSFKIRGHLVHVIVLRLESQLIDSNRGFFVVSIKSKLPKLIKRSTDVEMRKYDRTTKVKMNRHPDGEWDVKPLIIK